MICICALNVLQTAFVNLAHADWAVCMELEAVRPSLGLVIPQHWITLIAFMMAGLPLAFLAIGASRPDRSAWIAALLMLVATLYLMLPPSAMHDCDRKGSDAELVVIFLIPLSLFIASMVLLGRRTERH